MSPVGRSSMKRHWRRHWPEASFGERAWMSTRESRRLRRDPSAWTTSSSFPISAAQPTRRGYAWPWQRPGISSRGSGANDRTTSSLRFAAGLGGLAQRLVHAAGAVALEVQSDIGIAELLESGDHFSPGLFV